MKKIKIATVLTALMVSATLTVMATSGNTCGTKSDGECSNPTAACQSYFVWGWISWTTNGNCTTSGVGGAWCCLCQ